MTTETGTQPMTGDELIDWLANNLAQFNADETITPFTLTAAHPGIRHLRADNTLRALHAAGLLYRTTRGNDVYALRPDLPTSGNGHVWLRINNRASAPVEVIATQPRPNDNRNANQEYVHWTCTGCTKGHVSSLYINAEKHAQEHAGKCHGQALGS
ncbi:hypothetical protein OG301_39190 (plasmid) [Streptomyces platensis]|uniref:hypothetical protein n=1 Tax=Streptomyces platensis TaxID=58346 RepID=UPI002ED045BF|nr:hypothetical protein OG301_39190 [Streptomyces platensis]